MRGPSEIVPELIGHGLPLSKCEAYNRVSFSGAAAGVPLRRFGGRPTQPCRKPLFARVYEEGHARTYPFTYPKRVLRYSARERSNSYFEIRKI